MSVTTHILPKLPARPVRVRRQRGSRLFAAVAATGIALLGGSIAAQAQTTGFQIPVTGGGILARLGFGGGQQPSTFDPGDTPAFIDFLPTAFNYIGNPYMAVVQGVSGAFSVSYDQGEFVATSITHTVGGLLSFGNIGGSLRIQTDNLRALNGFGFEDYYGGVPIFGFTGGGIPAGIGVWPLPGYWQVPGSFDYSSYVSTIVDPVVTNGTVVDDTAKRTFVVGSDPATWIIQPTFRSNAGDNFLLSEARIVGNCVVHQEIRLFRNTAQLRWQIRNEDLAAHQVYLKFVVNNKDSDTVKLDTNAANLSGPLLPGFYYTDSERGPTVRSQIYGVNGDGTTARNIPTQIDILGSRYQTDTLASEPFHARYILDGFGATRPSTVFVGDAGENFPTNAGFSPGRTGVRRDLIENGVATTLYYGPITVAPGATSAPYITYYGNGDSSDILDPDFAIGTEAEESFQYNANAVNILNDQQRGNPTLADTAKQFLTPQQLNIYGSVYNRQLSEAQFNVVLKDVKMSVTLPDALRFATNPSTGVQDVSTKSIGDVPGDTDRISQWVAEPTGESFGTYTYQLIVSVGGISPLTKTVSRSVTIPATPLYKVSSDYYQMIGFPFEFDRTATNNNDTATIFNTLSKPADTNPGSLTLFKWVPDPESLNGSGRYQATTTIERGVGYFFRPAISRLLFLNGARPDVQATPVSSAQTTQYFQVVLERGWNMISNPWVYGVPVSFISLANIDNTDPNVNLDLTYFPEAVASGLVRGGIFFYNPDKRDYDFFSDFNQELKPYQGYWVFVEDRKILRIAVPSQKQSAVIPDPTGSVPVTRGIKKRVPSGALESGRAFPLQQTSTNWKMQLAAKRMGPNASDTANDSMTLLGVSADAKDGDDSRDLPKPPPVMQDYVSVRIMHEVKDGKSRAFAQDLKAPGGKKTWEIEVLSDRDGPVSLSWPNLSRLPRTVGLTLTDKATGRATSLRGASSKIVNVSANVPSRFVLTADKLATRPLAISNMIIKREGRAQGGSSSYSLQFKTTADAQIEARIITITGKTVSTLGGTSRAVAGSNVRMLWNGRAQDGTQLPIGAYQVEVTARDEDGAFVTSKRPVIVLE